MEKLLFYPMFAMTLLIVGAYINLGRTRAKLVKSKKVKMDYFKAYIPQSDYPMELYTSSRLLSNLFESPVIYFVINLLVISLKIYSFPFLILSILYVFLRYIHAFVLVKDVGIKYRFTTFVISQVALLSMWIISLIKLL